MTFLGAGMVFRIAVAFPYLLGRAVFRFFLESFGLLAAAWQNRNIKIHSIALERPLTSILSPPAPANRLRSFGFSILPVGFRGTSAKMIFRGRLYRTDFLAELVHLLLGELLSRLHLDDGSGDPLRAAGLAGR